MENQPPQEPSPDDLKTQTTEIADQARAKLKDIDQEFSGKLDHLNSRLKSARVNQAESTGIKNVTGLNPKEARGLGTGLVSAYALIGSPVLLYLLGVAIDNARQAGANDFKIAPFFGFAGFIIGMIFTVVVANKSAQ